MEIHFTKNKIKVIYYPIPNSFSTTIGLYVKVGSRNETPPNNGISHLLEHMHFRRLGDLTQHDLYNFTDRMGTTLRAETYKEITRYYLKVRPQFARKALTLFESILTMNQWTEEDLESEKKVVINEQRERQNDYDQQIDAMLFGESTMSLPILGNAHSVQGISLSNLLEHKSKHYFNENVFFVITGQCSADDIAYYDAFIENIPVSDGRTIIQDSKKKLHYQKHPKVILVNNHSNDVTVDIYFQITEDVSKEALTILNSIVGSGATSLLQRKLREEMGITFGLDSDLLTYSDVSFLTITYSTDVNHLQGSLYALVDILANMANEVSDEDMDTNLPFYTDNLWLWLEDTEEINYQIGWNILYNLEYRIEELIQRFASITKENIKDAAGKIFVSSKAFIFISGARKSVSKKSIQRILENKLIREQRIMISKGDREHREHRGRFLVLRENREK